MTSDPENFHCHKIELILRTIKHSDKQTITKPQIKKNSNNKKTQNFQCFSKIAFQMHQKRTNPNHLNFHLSVTRKPFEKH